MARVGSKWLKVLVLGVLVVSCIMSSSWAAPRLAQAADHPVEFLLKFKAPQAKAAVVQFAAQHRAHYRMEIARIGVHVLTFPANVDAQAALARLQSEPTVAYAERNSAMHASFIPTDPGYPNQWGLATIKAPQGWDVQAGNANTIIAIVDTGVDATHPDLAGKLVPGWNYDSFSVGYNTTNTTDNHGHGTHVAGIAAAVTDNGVGVAGTCPGCAIMPVKVLDSTGSGTYDAVASGIIYAADHGAKIINLSLGGTTPSQTLQDAAAYAHTQGTLLVAAAGNDGTNVTTYPAAYTTVMAVAATTSSDQRANFSNYNSYISVSAPGIDIYSTVWSSTSGSSYSYKSGTSMATPFVAGLAGLLKSQDSSRTNATLRALIEQSADDVDAAGWDQFTGYGRVNVGRAVAGSIVGTVTDGVTGATLINAQVDVIQAGHVTATTLTDADGKYRLLYLPAGTYDVRVTLAGYTPQTRTNIVTDVGQITIVDVALKRVGAIAGKVMSGRKALAGATVHAFQGAQVIASATTDAYGNYQMANVPAGTYDVKATATGYQGQTKNGIVVNPGQTTTGVNFSLSR